MYSSKAPMLCLISWMTRLRSKVGDGDGDGDGDGEGDYSSKGQQ
ncbi:unnamed protein product [Spirodela intermedia]|uniref:Uncharacterized protein n=1 Tax=Spirodela intermedia TaxID=51605 RepID=A0A7I8J5B9_SPIIN|nr:unnamed protein product [Spirodela intermedia]CAA6664611.1 unnamed protein product [Spirodela intermedia]